MRKVLSKAIAQLAGHLGSNRLMRKALLLDGSNLQRALALSSRSAWDGEFLPNTGLLEKDTVARDSGGTQSFVRA